MFKMYLHFATGYQLQLLSSLIVALGIFSYHFGNIWVFSRGNGIPVRISDSEASWIALVSLITLPFSSLGTICMANRFGLKSVLMVAPVPLIISWLLIYFSQHLWYFFVAGILDGVVNALFFTCGPIYISEISDPNIRGALQFLIPLLASTASLLTYYFGYTSLMKTFALLCIIPVIVYFVLLFWMPPSPYSFILQKKYEEAEVVLKLFRGKNYKDEEMRTLKKELELQMENNVTFRTIMNNHSDRKALSIVLMVILFQNLCGCTAVASYFHYIIYHSTIYIDNDKVTLVAGLLTVFGNVWSIIWIDGKGRRPLLLTSICISFVLMLILGFVAALRETRYDIILYDWVTSIALCMYIFFVNFGMVYVSYLLAGELFTTNVKIYGMSVVLVTNAVSAFVINKLFIYVSTHFGMSYMFFAFSIFSFAGYTFYVKYLPETRQKSLIEIPEMLQQSKESEKTEHTYF